MSTGLLSQMAVLCFLVFFVPLELFFESSNAVRTAWLAWLEAETRSSFGAAVASLKFSQGYVADCALLCRPFLLGLPARGGFLLVTSMLSCFLFCLPLVVT